MYRPKRVNKSINGVNLDSLMDILTCVVGVMLFVVIFAVIEARGTGIKMVAPIAKTPKEGSNRIIFLCRNGKILPFISKEAAKELIKSKIKLSYDTVPKFVDHANSKKVQDDLYTYKLNYVQWSDGSWLNQARRRAILLIVDLKDDSSGETETDIEELSSMYRQTLSAVDSGSFWIAFLVDVNSIEVFRKAREIAIEKGFAIGWDPGSLKFPYKEVILGGDGESRGEYYPKRDLSTTQNN